MINVNKISSTCTENSVKSKGVLRNVVSVFIPKSFMNFGISKRKKNLVEISDIKMCYGQNELVGILLMKKEIKLYETLNIRPSVNYYI